MKLNIAHLVRASLLVGFTAGAVAAEAFTINIAAGNIGGAGDTLVGTTLTLSESLYGQAGGPSTFNTLLLSFSTVTGLGSGTFTGLSPAATLNFTVNYSHMTMSASGTSYSGTWSYVSGTGGYANLVGSGTTSSTTANYGAVISAETGVQGTLTPVPEAPSIAVLGVGALGLIRLRRRRK